jgi:hypothetical protein
MMTFIVSGVIVSNPVGRSSMMMLRLRMMRMMMRMSIRMRIRMWMRIRTRIMPQSWIWKIPVIERVVWRIYFELAAMCSIALTM